MLFLDGFFLWIWMFGFFGYLDTFCYQSTSDTKVYGRHILNKGINALFFKYGKYCIVCNYLHNFQVINLNPLSITTWLNTKTNKKFLMINDRRNLTKVLTAPITIAGKWFIERCAKINQNFLSNILSCWIIATKYFEEKILPN